MHQLLKEQATWEQASGKLLEGVPADKVKLTKALMEQQRAAILKETAAGTGVTASAIDNFQKITIPMIRRIVPGTISTDLVGMQPMSGPVGLVYSLRFAFSEAADGNGVAANDIAAGDEVFANNSKMKRFYSTANVGTTGYPPALTAATTNGVAAATADYEGFGGRALRLQVLKQTITAGSRKLQARWTVEAAQDITSQHGLDLENELTAALAAQIAHEIDNEILTDLLGLAGSVGTYDFAAQPANLTPNYLGDSYANLGVLVNKLAAEIGAKTRRGPGNWLVGSYLITSMLQSAAKSVFAPAIAGSFDAPVGNKLVGTLNGQLKVYSYNWGLNDAWSFADNSADNAMGATGEDILIGYKGGASELDSGYFYCPYVPLMSSGVITDPNTFNPAVSLMTRYGKATFTSATTSLGNSADYYARIRVQNVAFS
jgi:hypothetical protein